MTKKKLFSLALAFMAMVIHAWADTNLLPETDG